MNIYKYGITKEKKLYVLECPVLNTREVKINYSSMVSFYEIQEGNKRKWVHPEDLEVFNNKVMYSIHPDKREEFIDLLKDNYKETISSYLNKADTAKNNFAEFLKVNNLL